MEPTTTENYDESTDPESTIPHHNILKIIFSGVIAVLIILALFFVLQSKPVADDVLPTDQAPVASTIEYEEILRKSTSGEDQTALQQYFVQSIDDGKNDASTKSAIYWITHRYFDNGGNIYEIYDFIEQNPSVAFLKGAEQQYPDTFEKIKTTRVENYGLDSLIALLAYYETIDNNGYGNIAIWGLAANKYSEQALANRPNASDSTDVAKGRATWYKHTIFMTESFVAKVDSYLVKNTMKTGELEELVSTTDVSPEDLLVGLNQYAAAALHLEATDSTYNPIIDPSKVFEFSSKFALEKVPRLYFFTNYLYATALVRGERGTSETVSVPLSRVVDYAIMNADWRSGGSIFRTVGAKNTTEAGVFSHSVAKKLAALDPKFKAWLVQNGWEDKDF